MTPIEAMAKAAYDEFVGPMRVIEPAWEILPDSHRNRMMESMSAALLALAECDLSDELIDGEAEGMIWATSGDQIDMHRNNFKAIIRSIATGGEE